MSNLRATNSHREVYNIKGESLIFIVCSWNSYYSLQYKELYPLPMYIAVNGGWCLWRSSGSCSKTCGTGSQRRVRSCTCPSPKHGGSSCSGSSTGYRDCNTQCCPGEPQHQNFHSIFTHHPVKYVDACFHARRLQLLV